MELILASTSSNTLAVAVPAAASITVAVLTGLAAYLASKRERRRGLYGEATKAAVGWHEMLYRVRRRGVADDRKLIEQFHDLQDQITYYRAWIGSESQYVQRSYDRLVLAVKAATQPLINQAWDQPVREPPANALPDDVHPGISGDTAAFLKDVRSQLSPWPWRKLAVRCRNRQG